MSERKQTDYNEIIGIDEYNSIIICDYIFKYEDGFKGATGTSLAPVSQEYIDERNDIEAFKEEHEWLWKDAVSADATELGFDDYMQELFDDQECNSDGEFFGHDNSSVHLVSDEFQEEHFPDAATFECIGGGRMFCGVMRFKKVFRKDILDAIVEIEDDFSYEVVEDAEV